MHQFDPTIPNLIDDINLRTQQINHVELENERLANFKHLYEEENIRLRAFYSDMQYKYESTIKAREYEIDRLNGRVIYLEEELYHLQTQAQKPLSGYAKNTYDPNKVKDLESALSLKDQEISQLKRTVDEQAALIKKLKNQLENQQPEVVEKVSVDIPGMNEDDVVAMKKINDQLRKELKEINDEMNELKSKYNEAQGEINFLKKKIKEYQIQDKIKLEGDQQYAKNVQQVFVKVSEDKNILEGILGFLHYVRESVCDILFEVFIRSANQAHQRKNSSLIIFTINLKELKSMSVKGFLVMLYLYQKYYLYLLYKFNRMKKFIKIYYPNYGKLGISADYAKISLGEGTIQKANQIRDGTNEWLEQSLSMAVLQRKKNRTEQLYRLLALKYRTKYPLQGQRAMNVDQDLRIRLEDKILGESTVIFLDEQE